MAMTDDEKAELKAKSTSMRERLRNGRANKRSTDTIGHSQSTNGADGSSVQVDGRASQGSKGNITRIKSSNSRNDNRKRGGTGLHIGPGRDSRRSSESNGGSIDTGTGRAARTAGRLETDDPIPERAPDPETPEFEFTEDPSLAKAQRIFYQEDYRRARGNYILITDSSQKVTPREYKALPSRKQIQQEDAKPTQNETVKGASGPKVSFMKNGKLLTVKEAEELLEPLIAALLSDFEYIDKGIWLYAMSQDQQPIWSDMAREEVEVLAHIMLKRGQRSPEAATAIRALVDSDIYIQVGAITVPRVIKTYRTLKGSPRPMIQKQRRDARAQARKERFNRANRA